MNWGGLKNVRPSSKQKKGREKMIITNKGYSDLSFHTPSGLVTIKGQGVLNNIANNDWEYILDNYGGFIRENAFSDKNPSGYLIWNERECEAAAAGRELEFTEHVDGCAPMTEAEAAKECAGVDAKKSVDGMEWRELRAYASSLGVKFTNKWNRAQLVEAVKAAENG